MVVTCLNAFEDNPHISWEAKKIAQVLEKAIVQQHQQQQQQEDLNNICVLTFDERGVSGHPNHIDTYRGVQYWLSSSTTLKNTTTTTTTIRGFKLKTISNPLVKYLPPVWWLCTLMFGRESAASEYVCYKPWLVWKAMAAHVSQFLWYRRLSVVFSCYTYHNQWHEIEHDSKS
jgi:N-acetylglucosaminylphosphatidylinositol deacetylase